MKAGLGRLWGSLGMRLLLVIVVAFVGAAVAAGAALLLLDVRATDHNQALGSPWAGEGSEWGPVITIHGVSLPDPDQAYARQSTMYNDLQNMEGWLGVDTLRSLSRAAPHIPEKPYADMLSLVSASGVAQVGEGRIPAKLAATWGEGEADSGHAVPKAAVRQAARRGWDSGGFGKASDPNFAGQYAAWREVGGAVRYIWFVEEPPPGTVASVTPGQILFTVVLALLAAAALAAWLVARSVVRPVRRAEASALLLAARDDPAPLPVAGPREIASLSASFNTMAEKLSRAQEAEQSFLLSVSHELKTPLTAIQGYGETLSEGRADPRTAGEVITKEASRLKRLVQDVLDLGRARRSSFAVRDELVDLAEIARDVQERYAGPAREFGLDLQVEAAGPAPALADNDRVLQVVSNLVENALRCTPAEGAVTIVASPGRLRVTDTGPGLVRADLDRAFERFFLYERCGADRQVGSGLGLAIVKELTEAMRGEVTVESQLGIGTIFEVTLPTVDAGSI